MVKSNTYRFNAHMNNILADAMQGVQKIVNTSQAKAVATALIKSQAFRVDLHLPPSQWFRWKCGIVAPCGCDCRSINGHPDVRRLIDGALTKAVQSTFPEVDYIVGVANAGIPWAKTLADRLHLPLAYVRSSPKMMGKGDLVECAPKGGQRALVVEDIVASGKSTINAIDAIHRETNLRVLGVQSLVNWNFPSTSLSLGGYVVRTLTSYPFIVSSAFLEGMIDEEGYTQLMTFYKDPHQHPWVQYYQKSGLDHQKQEDKQ